MGEDPRRAGRLKELLDQSLGKQKLLIFSIPSAQASFGLSNRNRALLLVRPGY
jgi:hypothetical protein